MSSNHIPFDIQTDILQRLPVKSLVRFQLVLKQWKSLINSPEFIKNHYRGNDTHYQHHLFVIRSDPGHEYQDGNKYISIIDNDVFPNQKSSYTIPPLLRSSTDMYEDFVTCVNVNSLLCFLVYHDTFKDYFAVFWNPSVGKSVAIKIHGLWPDDFIGFGFCPDTFDPKLVWVKISDHTYRWDVDVFTLSSRVWKKVYREHKPFYDWYLKSDHVCIKGCIYWQAEHRRGQHTNAIVSFDLKTEMFGKVCLLDRLLRTCKWRVVEVNESLGVLEYDSVGGCVWMMEFVTKSFTKMFTFKIPGNVLYYEVLGFRKNGEVIIQFQDENKSGLAAYEPSSRHFKDIGIHGGTKDGHGELIKVMPYMESLVLLDQKSYIIP